MYNLKELPEDSKIALENSDSFELLHLDPYGNPKNFYGSQILKSIEVKDNNVKKSLINAFELAVKSSSGLHTRCASLPRHGIRILYHEKTFDFIIGFSCEEGMVYEDHKHIRDFTITSDPRYSSHDLFNKILNVESSSESEGTIVYNSTSPE